MASHFIYSTHICFPDKQLLEKKLKEVEDAYEQVLKEKEEQLKESTLSSQKKLKRSANKSPIRVSDRFKVRNEHCRHMIH